MNERKNEIGLGSILTMDQTSYQVQFDKKEYGVENVLDQNIICLNEYSDEYAHYGKHFQRNLQPFLTGDKSKEDKYTIENTSTTLHALEIYAYMIPLLEMKNIVLKEIKKMHETYIQTQDSNSEFRQTYAWLGILSKSLSSSIDQLIEQFRKELKYKEPIKPSNEVTNALTIGADIYKPFPADIITHIDAILTTPGIGDEEERKKVHMLVSSFFKMMLVLCKHNELLTSTNQDSPLENVQEKNSAFIVSYIKGHLENFEVNQTDPLSKQYDDIKNKMTTLTKKLLNL